jgi:hypothetical protein
LGCAVVEGEITLPGLLLGLAVEKSLCLSLSLSTLLVPEPLLSSVFSNKFVSVPVSMAFSISSHTKSKIDP